MVSDANLYPIEWTESQVERNSAKFKKEDLDDTDPEFQKCNTIRSRKCKYHAKCNIFFCSLQILF